MPTLPISTALMEALPETISDLYSRDVEGMSDEDIDRLIEDQRAHRARMEQAEALGKRAPREAKGPSTRIGRTAPRPDLDISGLEGIEL